MDDYERAIEFSNQCREMYLKRVEASQVFKSNMKGKEIAKASKLKKASSLDSALGSLRSEMASLLNQDVSLMRQLLTMNETLEELKTKRLYGVCKDSLGDSMNCVSTSDVSLSSEIHSNSDNGK